jgi:hypothetical protein
LLKKANLKIRSYDQIRKYKVQPMSGRGMDFGFFVAVLFGFDNSVFCAADGDEEHDAMMDTYVICDPESFFATSGTFSKSRLISMRGMLVT